MLCVINLYISAISSWSPYHYILPALYNLWIRDPSKVSRQSADAIKLGTMCNMLTSTNQLNHP